MHDSFLAALGTHSSVSQAVRGFHARFKEYDVILCSGVFRLTLAVSRKTAKGLCVSHNGALLKQPDFLGRRTGALSATLFLGIVEAQKQPFPAFSAC